jgi:hypothetical protein
MCIAEAYSEDRPVKAVRVTLRVDEDAYLLLKYFASVNGLSPGRAAPISIRREMSNQDVALSENLPAPDR